MASGNGAARTRAVIFDLDGTLADTLDDITNAMNRVLATIEHEPVSRERMRSLIGQGLPSLMRRATGLDDEDVIRDLVERYRPMYRATMLDETRLYPKIAGVLDALTSAGVKMSVLSNKPHDLTLPICERLLDKWAFVVLRGHESPCARKPDPATTLEIAAAMNVDPSATVFVGDSDVDVLTARNAGMTSVAVTWGFRDLDHLLACEPAHVIGDPFRLVELVTNSGGDSPSLG